MLNYFFCLRTHISENTPGNQDNNVTYSAVSLYQRLPHREHVNNRNHGNQGVTHITGVTHTHTGTTLNTA